MPEGNDNNNKKENNPFKKEYISSEVPVDQIPQTIGNLFEKETGERHEVPNMPTYQPPPGHSGGGGGNDGGGDGGGNDGGGDGGGNDGGGDGGGNDGGGDGGSGNGGGGSGTGNQGSGIVINNNTYVNLEHFLEKFLEKGVNVNASGGSVGKVSATGGEGGSGYGGSATANPNVTANGGSGGSGYGGNSNNSSTNSANNSSNANNSSKNSSNNSSKSEGGDSYASGGRSNQSSTINGGNASAESGGSYSRSGANSENSNVIDDGAYKEIVTSIINEINELKKEDEKSSTTYNITNNKTEKLADTINAYISNNVKQEKKKENGDFAATASIAYLANRYLERKRIADPNNKDAYENNLDELRNTMAKVTENGEYLKGAKEAMEGYLTWIRDELKENPEEVGAKKGQYKKPNIKTAAKYVNIDTFEKFVKDKYNGDVNNLLSKHGIYTHK